MASVAFLRAANVGGHQVFRPSVFVKELAHLDAINIGAAGTFVVRADIGQASLRRELEARLPVPAETMICSEREILALRDDRWLPEAGAKAFVSVLAKRPRKLPSLPLEQPEGEDWQVRLVEVRGKLVLSHFRRTGKTLIYPNEVVEKRVGVSATTRGWSTFQRILRILVD